MTNTETKPMSDVDEGAFEALMDADSYCYNQALPFTAARAYDAESPYLTQRPVDLEWKMAKDRSGAENDDHWQTPQWLYDKLDAEFNFDFDPCPIHSDFDGLTIPWGRANFINPPYNRVDKPKFIQKAFDEWMLGKTCVLLILSATGTSQFHDLILPHAEVRFHRGRICFIPPELPRNATEKQVREFLQRKYPDTKTKHSGKGKHDSMIVIFRATQTPYTEKGGR